MAYKYNYWLFIVNNKYLKLLQERTGYLAIGRSTLRNQGASGVIDVARVYLQKMNLKALGDVSSEVDFQRFLNRHTKALANKFPNGAKGNWGAARKALNIFLRDCLYNHYLRGWLEIKHVEEWLEVPLDGDVARNLYEMYSDELPKWTSIKSLTPDVSFKYQMAASKVSIKEEVSRIHLDVKYWRDGKFATVK
ncbi:hypothetical protein Maes01_01388 [Microbulbifer aestuariivivens]|uniref:Uncharacterized protein n=1 Tax=Microbulbifer aestuariivivens TaxID=1908308 RepID=A0ABP9WP75_9GAMM